MWKIPQFISPFQLGFFPVCLSVVVVVYYYKHAVMSILALVPLNQGFPKGINPGVETLGCGMYTASTWLFLNYSINGCNNLYSQEQCMRVPVYLYLLTICHFQILILVNLMFISTCCVLSFITYAKKFLNAKRNFKQKSLTNE